MARDSNGVVVYSKVVAMSGQDTHDRDMGKQALVDIRGENAHSDGWGTKLVEQQQVDLQAAVAAAAAGSDYSLEEPTTQEQLLMAEGQEKQDSAAG